MCREPLLYLRISPCYDLSMKSTIGRWIFAVGSTFIWVFIFKPITGLGAAIAIGVALGGWWIFDSGKKKSK